MVLDQNGEIVYDVHSTVFEWVSDPDDERDIYAFGGIYKAHLHIENGVRVTWEVAVLNKVETGWAPTLLKARVQAKLAILQMLQDSAHKPPFEIRRGDTVALLYDPTLKGTVTNLMVDEDGYKWALVNCSRLESWWLVMELDLVRQGRVRIFEPAEQIPLFGNTKVAYGNQ